MTAKSVMAAVWLRHRAPGHLRFDLPVVLCGDDIAHYLERGLHQVEGIRQARVYVQQRKLSVYYLDTVCSAHQVVRKLAQLIELLDRRGWLTTAAAPAPRSLWTRLREVKPLARIKARYQDLKAKAQMVSAIAKVQWQYNPALRMLGDNPEKAIIGFINDAVTFYLIKVHWTLIINKWLKQPIRFRYEWATVFYLVFLLVRARKKQP